jgi:hypothetical protein
MNRSKAIEEAKAGYRAARAVFCGSGAGCVGDASGVGAWRPVRLQCGPITAVQSLPVRPGRRPATPQLARGRRRDAGPVDANTAVKRAFLPERPVWRELQQALSGQEL